MTTTEPVKLDLDLVQSAVLSETLREHPAALAVVGRTSYPAPPGAWSLWLVPCSVEAGDRAVRVARGEGWGNPYHKGRGCYRSPPRSSCSHLVHSRRDDGWQQIVALQRWHSVSVPPLEYRMRGCRPLQVANHHWRHWSRASASAVIVTCGTSTVLAVLDLRVAACHSCAGNRQRLHRATVGPPPTTRRWPPLGSPSPPAAATPARTRVAPAHRPSLCASLAGDRCVRLPDTGACLAGRLRASWWPHGPIHGATPVQGISLAGLAGGSRASRWTSVTGPESNAALQGHLV